MLSAGWFGIGIDDSFPKLFNSLIQHQDRFYSIPSIQPRHHGPKHHRYITAHNFQHLRRFQIAAISASFRDTRIQVVVALIDAAMSRSIRLSYRSLIRSEYDLFDVHLIDLMAALIWAELVRARVVSSIYVFL